MALGLGKPKKPRLGMGHESATRTGAENKGASDYGAWHWGDLGHEEFLPNANTELQKLPDTKKMENKEVPGVGYRQRFLFQALAVSAWQGVRETLGTEETRLGGVGSCNHLGCTRNSHGTAEVVSFNKRICSLFAVSVMVGYEKIRLS